MTKNRNVAVLMAAVATWTACAATPKDYPEWISFVNGGAADYAKLVASAAQGGTRSVASAAQGGTRSVASAAATEKALLRDNLRYPVAYRPGEGGPRRLRGLTVDGDDDALARGASRRSEVRTGSVRPSGQQRHGRRRFLQEVRRFVSNAGLESRQTADWNRVKLPIGIASNCRLLIDGLRDVW